MGQSRAGTVVPRCRQPWRLLLSLLGAILLVLLSPERSHAADRPAPATAAVPQSTAMPAGIADTPAARFLAAVRSLSLARLLAVAKSLPGEGTAVLSVSSHRCTRTAVLSPSPARGPGADLGVLVPGRATTMRSVARSAHLERSGIRARTYEPLVPPG
ncbi:MAG TPA: hypothetical protein VGJ54_19180 [Streptosporangiaceae bacterium]